MINPGNNRILNKLTILFIAAFILIKVSPLYYRCQYMLFTGLREQGEVFKMHSRARNTDLLVRAQKSIVDGEARAQLVPVIKFTGILFGLFFTGLCLIPAKFTYILTDHRSSAREVCITQCILRL
ncbi:MAG TPA: hypothetical protein VG367_19555 [Mucilaginibacter sp.]|nr:hypothetical protein [Mucilaginibacter sp.]